MYLVAGVYIDEMEKADTPDPSITTWQRTGHPWIEGSIFRGWRYYFSSAGGLGVETPDLQSRRFVNG